MKKFITLFLLFLYTYINGQVTQIVPFNTYSFSQPNGTYFKDLDNTLNYYEGTWEGILNNKKYTFIFKKFEQVLVGFPPNYDYIDKLTVKFKVTDLSTNQILYNNLSALNYTDYLIKTFSIPAHGLLTFHFTDTNANCNNTAEFTIRRNNNDNLAIEYCYYREGEGWNPEICGKTDYDYDYKYSLPIFLPKQNLILRKL